MDILKRHFLPENLLPHLRKNKFDGCVTIQVSQTEDENAFMLAAAEVYSFVKGIVGWVDLQTEDIEERLKYYAEFSVMKGFRHVLQDETDPDFMLRPAFLHGISSVEHLVRKVNV